MGEPAAASSQREPVTPDEACRVLTALSLGMLDHFLASGARLTFPARDQPEVSVLVVLCNRAELTLRCLRALAEIHEPSLDVVIVDNASIDRTADLLDRLDCVTILRNPENLGFLLAVNQAAAVARGRTLLLLNNDAELLPGSLACALATLDSSSQIGAVGGRLISPDGRLQEAGDILWNDGSCLAYGRGDDPRSPLYMFQRDVDYCSGALLLTPRALWTSLGGFDTSFAPAYYEDTDYCTRLWQAGYRVVYQPRAGALHFEFASSSSHRDAIAMQTERRSVFFRKHRAWLAQQPPPEPTRVLHARSARSEGPRILVLDDRVPHSHLGGGAPRACEMVATLVRLGWSVTLMPLSFPEEPWESVYAELPPTVEVLLEHGPERLAPLLEERRGFFQAILVSRPHNMQRLQAAQARLREPLEVPVIYDAEAIFAQREVAARRLHGEQVSANEAARLVDEELALARAAAAVLTVSPADRAAFERNGPARIFTVGHAIAPEPTCQPFAEREGLLFVGALNEDESPNVDSLHWFVTGVLPRLFHELDASVPFLVAGGTSLPSVLALAGHEVRLLGRVDDIKALYGAARLFVAPTRFAAGVPFKVHHAAAHGLPVVATSLLANQLGWQPDRDLLVADDQESFARACARAYRDADLWQRVRLAALGRVAQDCSCESFETSLAEALAAAEVGRCARRR
jgi:GT2 family glycosyltransferase/glycosyltransferase involved in cell wall biosynthesis